MQATATDAGADSLVRDAQRRIYRFPVGFGGFAARVVSETPVGTGEGEVEVRVGAAPSVELRGGGVEEWVVSELRSIVAHRSPRSPEDGDGGFVKRLGPDELLGKRVEIEDTMESSYVIGEGRIVLISRAHGNGRFTIAIQGREATRDGSELPTAFTVFHWDQAGKPIASEAFTDAYVELAGVLVPAVRTVVRADASGIAVRKLTLTEHAAIGSAS